MLITNRALTSPLFDFLLLKAGLFDEVIVNDDFQATVNAFFRLMRDWYVSITCILLGVL